MHPQLYQMTGLQFVIMLAIYIAITFSAIMFSGANKFLFAKKPDSDIKEEPQEAKF